MTETNTDWGPALTTTQQENVLKDLAEMRRHMSAQTDRILRSPEFWNAIAREFNRQGYTTEVLTGGVYLHLATDAVPFPPNHDWTDELDIPTGVFIKHSSHDNAWVIIWTDFAWMIDIATFSYPGPGLVLDLDRVADHATRLLDIAQKAWQRKMPLFR